MAGNYGALGGDAHIKVRTEDLVAKAETTKTAISNMKKSLDEITQKVEQMSGYWEGEAADTARANYARQKETLEKVLTALEEYPGKLLSIAGVYSPAESANVDTSAGLRDHVL